MPGPSRNVLDKTSGATGLLYILPRLRECSYCTTGGLGILQTCADAGKLVWIKLWLGIRVAEACAGE